MMMERLFQLMKEKNASDMFFAVNSPGLMEGMPRYFRNTMNLGFLITIVCAGVMVLFSGDGSGYPLFRATTKDRPPEMTAAQRRRYRTMVVVLIVLWLAVVAGLSPWGLALWAVR